MRRAILLTAALCALSGLLVACGDDSDDDSGQSDVCNAKASLDQSVQNLKDVNITQNGLSSLESAVDDVKADAQALADAGSGDVKSDAQALEDNLTALGTAITQVASNGLAPVTDAASTVKTSADALVDTLKSESCSS
jgi:hypothetical protein